MTLAQFLTEQETKGRPIGFDCHRAERNPLMVSDDRWAREASHWYCFFTFQDREFSCHFSQGSAHKDPPTAEDVLECLLSDARSVLPEWDESNGAADVVVPFEEWASDLGFDPDSRKAERSYNVTVEQTRKLRAFLTPLLYRQALRTEED